MNDPWGLQSAGGDRYAGALLHERYQVLECAALKGQYYIADLKGRTVVRTTSHKAVGEIIRFDSIAEAEEYAAELAGQKVDKPIARPAGRLASGKDKGGSRVVAGDTAAAMFRRLILAGDMTDDQIFKAVQEKFGLADNRRAYVNWYRKELEKKGLLKK